MADPSCTVVVPAYNEAAILGETLVEIQSCFASRRDVWAAVQIIVVADGCSDNTADIARQHVSPDWPVDVIAYPENRGKGYALRQGFAASRGDVVLFADADGSTPMSAVDVVTPPILADEADVVVGSRRVPGANVTVDQGLARRALGYAFRQAVNLLTGLAITDTQCGFKAFRGEPLRRLSAACQCDGFAIDVELLMLARAQGLRIREVGVPWVNRSASKVHPLSDGCRMLRDVWQIRRRLPEARHGRS